MFFGKLQKFRKASHRAIVTHDFADDADGPAARQLDKIHGSLGVTSALQDSAWSRAQRKYMTRLNQVLGNSRWFCHDSDGLGAIRSTNSGCDALRSIHANLEIGLKRFSILLDHSFNPELLKSFGNSGHTNQPSSVFGHEIDGLRRYELSSHEQIAFIFTVGIVDDNDHLSLLQVMDNGFYGIEFLRHRRSQASGKAPVYQRQRTGPVASFPRN